MRNVTTRRARGYATSLILVLTLASGGCIPHVGHGPRVEPGTSLFLNGSFTSAPQLQDEQVTVMPGIYAGVARGWTFGRSAASVGLQVPVLALPLAFLGDADFDVWSALFLADVYVQPYRGAEGGTDFGVGALLSRHIAAPYIQVGRASDGGVYTTQMVARTHSGLDATWYWIPTVAHRTVVPASSRAVDFYLTGAIGWPEEPSRFREYEREWFISAGVLLELRPGRNDD